MGPGNCASLRPARASYRSRGAGAEGARGCQGALQRLPEDPERVRGGAGEGRQAGITDRQPTRGSCGGDALMAVRHALAEALRLDPTAVGFDDPFLETVDGEGAAKLLQTTPRAVYVRHQRGQMPRPVGGAKGAKGRPLWRQADLPETTAASSTRLGR